MSEPACNCDISKIFNYNKSNNTLTIKGDLVVEGNGSEAAVKIGSSSKPGNVWVIGGVDINGTTDATGTTGYANPGDLRVGNDFFVKNRTILGDDELPQSGLTLPDQHVYLTGSMDIGLNSGFEWATSNSVQVQGDAKVHGDVNADKILLQAYGTKPSDAPIIFQGLAPYNNKGTNWAEAYFMQYQPKKGLKLNQVTGAFYCDPKPC